MQKQASPQKSCKKIKITGFVSTYGILLCKFTAELIINHGQAAKFTAEDATKTESAANSTDEIAAGSYCPVRRADKGRA